MQKGVYLETVDYDQMFRSLSQPAVIVNNIDLRSEQAREHLNSLIYTHYNGDTLSNVPQCDGGHLKGEYNRGLMCKICNTLVEPITEKPLESLLWLEAPPGVPAFLHLTVFRILSNYLTYSGYNILEWLTDPFYRPTTKIPPIMLKVQTLNLPRGLRNFHDHYDQIMESLFKNKIIKARPAERNKLRAYLDKVRPVMFPKRLPFPSRLAFITEENNGTLYTDHKMQPAIDAILAIASMYSTHGEPSQELKEARCIRSIVKLNSYYRDFEKFTAFKKEGIFRKLIYGTRPHFTYRAVIGSNHKPHDYNTIELPWSLSVLLFKSHLDNKLLKQDLTPNEIRTLQYKNTLCYHPMIDGLFQELIAEAPGGKGIPTTFARNPTLKRGSIQRFDIPKIKTDPNDNTVSFSVLTLKAPNADFDGDALNGQLCLDKETADKLERLRPHTGVMNLNRPFRVSANVAFPTPFLSTSQAWLKEGDEISPVPEQ